MTVIFSLLYLALSFGDLQSLLQPSSEELQETYCLDFLRFEVVLDGAGIDQKEYKNEK